MADEIIRLDYSAEDIGDNIDEVRTARGTYESLDARLDNIEGGGPSPSNPIASNRVSPMTGYSKSSSSTPGNISTSDTLNAAIGKLEKRTELNENNILSDNIINTSFTWGNGYISTGGYIFSSTQSYFSQPFTLHAGEKIVVRTKNKNICIIGSTTADSVAVGDNISILRTTSGVAQEETYDYTATEDIKIVICVLASNYVAYVANHNTDLMLGSYATAATKQLENNISSEQAKTTGMGTGGSDYITVNGIRVYVSSTAPTGDIPTGSIWIGG